MNEIMLPILSLIVGIISAIITARWSLRKIYTEKWWDRKEKAYTEIIEAIYAIMQYCEVKRDTEEEDKYFSDEKIRELQEDYSKAYWRLKKLTDIGSFVISPEGSIILNELKSRPKLSWRHNTPRDIYNEEFKYHKQALGKIVEIAKSDLKSNRY